MKPAPPPSPSRPFTTADLAVLIDGPAPHRLEQQAPHADALHATLDACLDQQLLGQQLAVVVRQPDSPHHQTAARHAARPTLLRPQAQAAPADALTQPLTLLLQPGVTPDQAALQHALQHLNQYPTLAAITFHVQRADHTTHAHPVPNSLHAAACLLQTPALQKAAGFSKLLPPGPAADLDLTCRLLRDGHPLQRADNLTFPQTHWPTPHAPTAKQHANALRDALLIHDRYFPKALRNPLRRDATDRAIALVDPLPQPGHHHLAKALRDARRAAQWEARRGRSTLHADQLETLLQWGATHRAVADFAQQHQLQRVVLAGHHPHLYLAHHAAHAAKLTVDAIADPHHDPQRTYRGLPVQPLDQALTQKTQAVLITDQHPATAQRTADQVAQHFAGPTLALHQPQHLNPSQTDADTPKHPLRLVA